MNGEKLKELLNCNDNIRTEVLDILNHLSELKREKNVNVAYVKEIKCGNELLIYDCYWTLDGLYYNLNIFNVDNDNSYFMEFEIEKDRLIEIIEDFLNRGLKQKKEEPKKTKNSVIAKISNMNDNLLLQVIDALRRYKASETVGLYGMGVLAQDVLLKDISDIEKNDIEIYKLGKKLLSEAKKRGLIKGSNKDE